MSLRLRLALMVLVLLVFGLLAIISRSVLQARESVRQGSESSSRVVSELMALIAPDVLELSPQIVSRLRTLNSVPHLDVEIISAAHEYPGINEGLAAQTVDAPSWYVALVRAPPQVLVGTLDLIPSERVIFRTRPSDAIEEVWEQTRTTLAIRMAALGLFTSLLFWLLGRWLAPLASFDRALEDIERGDFSRRIPLMPLPELGRLAEKINRLTTSLGASQAENERLSRKSMQIQEQERRYLSQELHDAMGQAISAIKAIAVSVEQRSRDTLPAVADSAQRIGDISDGVYTSVRGMMSRLRPSVLDELGLVPALQQMTDDWNGHHGDCFCRLRLEGDFDTIREEQQIHLYRIVQEALTNIAKHARAENVEVILSGGEVITLIINDDGQGYDPLLTEKGMGLMGIRERVQILHGELHISTRPRQGVSIQIEFPRQSRERRRRSTDVGPG